MSVSRTILVITAAWLAVVTAGSVLVWSVISRAGDVEPGPGTAVPAAATATSSDPTTRPARSSSAPSFSSSPSPSASASPSPSASTPGPSDGPTESAQRRTWQGPGGFVSVQCRAGVISLVAAQADAGFAVEVDDRGPEEVKLAFEGQGEEGRETEVTAVCRTGVPEFEISAED